MRIFGYLKNHLGAVALIILLLVTQAFCDLSLPKYTSNIVDVGIQQKGIEHPALIEMSGETYQELEILMNQGDTALFESSYTLNDDGTYSMNDEGRSHIDELDGIESLPEAMIGFAQDSGGMDLDALKQGVAMGLIGPAQIQSAKDKVIDQLGDMSGTIVTQKAILFAQGEYTALGLDVDRMQMDYLLGTGAIMFGFTLGIVVASILVGLIAARTAASIARDLREGIFKRVMEFSNTEFNDFSTASLITRSTNDIQQVQMVCFMLMRMVMYAPILGIGGVIMISTTNVSMSWIIGLAVLVLVGLVAFLFSLAMPKFKIMQSLIDRVNLVSREILTGVPVVRAFGRERHEEARFEVASRDLMKTQLFTNRAMIGMMPAMTLILNATSVLIVWTAAGQIDMGAMQVGDMIAFLTYAMIIIMSFLMLSMVSIMLPRASVAAGRIDEVLAKEPSIVDPLEPLDVDGIDVEHAGTVEFDHVSFRYDGAEEDTLHDITFSARPGTTTAIIGSTGSGKSTLLNLIPRFYDVTEGEVKVDGIDVRRMRQSDLRRHLGYVPQKGVLFSGTIESNIKFGGDDISDEMMKKAVGTAQAAEFVESREKGYDEFISQGGTNVSGGQKQRLSIARALATDASILLFDDSFSALDYRTDAQLRQALHDSAADMTVIIVAQRISTVLHADQIIVLDEGRVAGLGTHRELMETCTAYREIASSQLSDAEIEGVM